MEQGIDHWLPASELGIIPSFSSICDADYVNYKLDNLGIHNGGKSCWAAAFNNYDQFVQFSSLNPVKFTGVTTQGRGDFDQWVKEYLVAYSLDDKTWKAVDNGTIFTANSDRDSKIPHVFTTPVMARTLRIKPVSWHNHISMRIEAYFEDNV